MRNSATEITADVAVVVVIYDIDRSVR